MQLTELWAPLLKLSLSINCKQLDCTLGDLPKCWKIQKINIELSISNMCFKDENVYKKKKGSSLLPTKQTPRVLGMAGPVDWEINFTEWSCLQNYRVKKQFSEKNSKHCNKCLFSTAPHKEFWLVFPWKEIFSHTYVLY